MGKTIGERLTEIQRLTLYRWTAGALPFGPELCAELDAIIEEWNAAVEVLKVIASKSVYQLGDDIICEGCRKYASASAEVEHVLDCPVEALLRLIAKMEGINEYN